MRKNHNFDTNVFQRSLNSFQTRNFNCALVAKVTEAIFKTSDCLFTFISQNCLRMVDKHAFYVFLLKQRMSREFVVRSLEVGIDDHKF